MSAEPKSGGHEVEEVTSPVLTDEDHKLKHTGSKDVALQLVDTLVASEFSAQEDRSTLRRIDAVLMPVMFISFALQFMDKACLTGAALFGILQDLKLVQL